MRSTCLFKLDLSLKLLVQLISVHIYFFTVSCSFFNFIFFNGGAFEVDGGFVVDGGLDCSGGGFENCGFDICVDGCVDCCVVICCGML